MSNERDWPFEKIPDKGLRPWFLSADGYLFALFTEVDEARRAKQSLLEQGVPDEDARLYASAEILGASPTAPKRVRIWPGRSPPLRRTMRSRDST